MNSRLSDSVEQTVEEGEAIKARSWLGYSWRVTTRIALGTWAALHYIGEKLAYGFGITSPDWQYAIDLYDTLKREEEEERTEEERALREEHRHRLERLRHLESAST